MTTAGPFAMTASDRDIASASATHVRREGPR